MAMEICIYLYVRTVDIYLLYGKTYTVCIHTYVEKSKRMMRGNILSHRVPTDYIVQRMCRLRMWESKRYITHNTIYNEHKFKYDTYYVRTYITPVNMHSHQNFGTVWSDSATYGVLPCLMRVVL